MPSSAAGVGDASPVDPKRQESSLGLQLGIVSAIHVTALVITILRLYSRAFLAKSVGCDDGFMLGATLSAFASYVLYIYESQHGLGLHKLFVSDDDLWEFGAATFAQTILNLLGLGLLKISLSFSLLRLCRGRAFKWILWGTIAFVTIYTIFAFLTLFLYCKPLSGFWDLNSGAKCYSVKLFIRFGLANTALSIFTDILLASLPIPVIWQLQLRTKLRVYLIIMLALGWGAVAIGVVKAIYQIRYNPLGDSTYEIGVPTWAFIQLNVGIIAACAPQLKKLLQPLLGFTSSYKSSPYGGPSHNRRTTTGHSIAGRYMRQRSHTDKTDGFELDERPIVPPDSYHVRVHGNDSGDKTTRTVDSSDTAGGERNSSGHNSMGIMRTTEVVISTT
ncbi:putative integral membrane protein [Rosellinia necatrix]|uniref:Putative integral membrane protein n=1 Tax=Rosellinia necatrix TaxID=77044 RepID=A0A1W2THZ8_ROSNE|nr:putative integral membrane protein [Rosellinia necatrix]